MCQLTQKSNERDEVAVYSKCETKVSELNAQFSHLHSKMFHEIMKWVMHRPVYDISSTGKMMIKQRIFPLFVIIFTIYPPLITLGNWENLKNGGLTGKTIHNWNCRRVTIFEPQFLRIWVWFRYFYHTQKILEIEVGMVCYPTCDVLCHTSIIEKMGQSWDLLHKMSLFTSYLSSNNCCELRDSKQLYGMICAQYDIVL